MSKEPTLEDKALALAALDAGVYVVPQSERYYSTTADMMSPIGVVLTSSAALYDSSVCALASAARLLGLEPDKQIMALETLRSRLSLSQKVDLYFDTVTDEQLLQDLKDAGFKVVPIKEDTK